MSPRLLFAYCICAVLAGCATAPQIEYRTVPVPIPVPCAVNVPAKPKYPEVKADDDVFEAAKKRRAEGEMKDAYIIELEAANRGCASPK